MIPKQEEIIVGLDIGSTKVCAVAGRLIRSNDHARLDVLGVGKAISKGVTKGSVVNIGQTVEAINRAVEEAAGQANIDIHVVNVSFSGQNVTARRQHGSITRTSPGDEVVADDIDHLVGDMYRSVLPAGAEIVHVLPMDFTVDSESNIDYPVGRIGVKLEADFQVITAQTSSASYTRKCIQRARSVSPQKEPLENDKFLLAPLASALAVLTDEEKHAGVALVDIGGGTTEIAIYHKNVLRHVAVVPYAGNSLTADLEVGCRVLPTQAELLKTKFGSADPTDFRLNEVVAVPNLSGRPPKDILLKNVALVIEARLKEIAAMVQAEIIRSGYRDKLVGGVVLTGGTASISGIERIFERVTGLDVRIGFPDQLEHNVKADLVSDPAFATAVGLVWAGFKRLDDRIPLQHMVLNPVIGSGTNGHGHGHGHGTNGQTSGKNAKDTGKGEEKGGGGFMTWVRKFLTDDIGKDLGPDDRYNQ
ncbi:cell division protein FtsA [Larkinella punicea]|jgi:cell division protein FtsA|uniref:Cell division protein FtsA n=1 Tax=Larkinella punicea TaxID=2315727 RepID=A0A368JL61_9BACT|nr:cell division protein FtsA [Larkinella punicea]RCR68025.1 cell division protein FtsA [Larkinella punicea]